MTGDLLYYRVVLTQRVGSSVPGLRLAAANVPAGCTGAQVERAAALLALLRPRISDDVGSVVAQALIENGGVHDFHVAHKVACVSVLTAFTGAIRRLLIPPIFVIELRDGPAIVKSGEPPAGLVAAFSSTARDAGLERGTIYALRASHGLTLDFSSDIPVGLHQRFRNVFGVYRHRIKS